MINDIWEARRIKLENELNKAALALIDHMNCAALMIGIDGTAPTMFVAVGEAKDIASHLKYATTAKEEM